MTRKKHEATIKIDLYLKSVGDAEYLVEALYNVLKAMEFEPEHLSCNFPIRLPEIPPRVDISGMDFGREDFHN